MDWPPLDPLDGLDDEVLDWLLDALEELLLELLLDEEDDELEEDDDDEDVEGDDGGVGMLGVVGVLALGHPDNKKSTPTRALILVRRIAKRLFIRFSAIRSFVMSFSIQ